MYVKLRYPDAKVNFLSTWEKVIAFEDCPGICLKDFLQYIILGWPFTLPNLKHVPELTRFKQNQPGGIAANHAYKIRPTLTTSEKGLETLNILISNPAGYNFKFWVVK